MKTYAFAAIAFILVTFATTPVFADGGGFTGWSGLIEEQPTVQ